MQHYISLLLKHRRLVLSGPSGTGKTYLASRLAEYLVDRSAREVTNGIVVTFNMHRQSCKVTVTDFLWESVQQGLILSVTLSAFLHLLTLFLSPHPPPQDLQLYLSNLANQIDRETSTSEIPLVVILDDIHDPTSISELVNGALTCKYHKW